METPLVTNGSTGDEVAVPTAHPAHLPRTQALCRTTCGREFDPVRWACPGCGPRPLLGTLQRAVLRDAPSRARPMTCLVVVRVRLAGAHRCTSLPAVRVVVRRSATDGEPSGCCWAISADGRPDIRPISVSEVRSCSAIGSSISSSGLRQVANESAQRPAADRSPFLIRSSARLFMAMGRPAAALVHQPIASSRSLSSRSTPRLVIASVWPRSAACSYRIRAWLGLLPANRTPRLNIAPVWPRSAKGRMRVMAIWRMLELEAVAATGQAAEVSTAASAAIRREPRQAARDIDLDRLAQAVAQWEVTALRVLHAQPPSVRDLAGIAHTEQALLVHTLVLLNASARSSVIDSGDFDRQIRPRLEGAQVAWGDVAASWPAQISTPAPPSMAGVEASAQLHRALDEITRNGNAWATSAHLAERVYLAEVVVLLRDVVAASGSRAERFAELPAEFARAGHLHAPARILVAMERQTSGRESEAESAVRTTDVANRRIIVVQPEQTTGATATARALVHRLTALIAALETIPLDRQSQSSAESLPSAHETTRGLEHASGARANVQLTRHAAVRR